MLIRTLVRIGMILAVIAAVGLGSWWLLSASDLRMSKSDLIGCWRHEPRLGKIDHTPPVTYCFRPDGTGFRRTERAGTPVADDGHFEWQMPQNGSVDLFGQSCTIVWQQDRTGFLLRGCARAAHLHLWRRTCRQFRGPNDAIDENRPGCDPG